MVKLDELFEPTIFINMEKVRAIILMKPRLSYKVNLLKQITVIKKYYALIKITD